LYFQLPYLLPQETCFQQAGSSSVVGGTSQAVLGCSDQRKVPASLSKLKSEKIPALLFVGKGPGLSIQALLLYVIKYGQNHFFNLEDKVID